MIKSDKAWVEALAKGEIALHQLPPEMATERAVTLRRRGLQKHTGTSLNAMAAYGFNPGDAHCENMIGAVQIPLGVAGPLMLHGEYVTGDEALFVPLATTEGALIASISRGCKALTRAGGATVRVDDVGITRAPVFQTRGLLHTRACVEWVNQHFTQLKVACDSGSRFLQLQEISPSQVGRSLWLRFRFTSGDAMGMNMATLACERAIRMIESATGARCISVSGNLCTDKKSAGINFLHGRGKRIYAEIELDSETLWQVLKTRASPICEVQYHKNLLGSIMADAHGYNAHHANVLAAFFLACGQDVAQVAESASGITCLEPLNNGGIYASVMLPDTPLATIGGGTSLDAQRQALALMGIHQSDQAEPGKNVMRLAEILGGAVLAGELSILAAQAAHHLGAAHQKLGRH